MQQNLYMKKGQVANSAIGSVVALVVAVGVITVVIIFIGVLGGQTFQLSQSTYGNFTNTTTGNAVGAALNGTAVSGFQALEQTASYVPLVVVAVVIFVVLTLVLGFTMMSTKNGGSAL